MSIKRSAMQGGVYLFIRQLFSIAMKAVGVVLISRVLGPERYGSYVAAFGIYQYAQTVGQVGIGVYLLRHADEVTERTYGTATAMLLGLAAVMVCVVEAALRSLESWIDVPGASQVLSLMVLALPLQLLTVPMLARLERDLRYGPVAATEIIGQFGYYVVAVPLILLGRGPVALAEAFVVQHLVLAVAVHLCARRVPTIAWSRNTAVDILRYAAGFSGANWIWQARGLVNPLVVGHFLGAQAVGLVGMTVGLVEMLSIIKTIAWRLSVVVLGRYQDEKAKLVRGITEGMLLQTLAVGTILLGFGWVGHMAVPILFGDRWAPVMDIYPYVALAYFVNAQFTMHSSALSVLERNGAVALFNFVHVAIFAAVALAMVPRIGIMGYGWGEVAALVSYALLHALVARVVGNPDYQVAAIWFLGVVVGLFWRELGPWAIAVPFLALAMPPSLRQLAQFYTEFTSRGRGVAHAT